jgi:hypothetical protein
LVVERWVLLVLEWWVPWGLRATSVLELWVLSVMEQWAPSVTEQWAPSAFAVVVEMSPPACHWTMMTMRVTGIYSISIRGAGVSLESALLRNHKDDNLARYYYCTGV